MASGNGASKSSNSSRVRKRVEVEKDSSSSSSSTSLLRAKDGSAFARCGECNRDVAMALISMHNCSLDARIKMNLEPQAVEQTTEVKKKQAEKRKAKAAEPKAKKGKKAKNSNALKRPPTAFFIFMDDFRKSFKEENPVRVSQRWLRRLVRNGSP